VAANRALLHRFVRACAHGPVILMGNSMGGMISLLEASAAPRLVAGLVLVDPALPFVPAWPDPLVTAMFAVNATPGLSGLMMNRRRVMTPEAAVAATMSLCCADSSRVPRDVVAQHVAMARQRAAFPEVSHDFSTAMRSVLAARPGLGRGRLRPPGRGLAHGPVPGTPGMGDPSTRPRFRGISPPQRRAFSPDPGETQQQCRAMAAPAGRTARPAAGRALGLG